MDHDGTLKQCSQCREWLPLSCFNRRADCKADGLQYTCKQCHNTHAYSTRVDQLTKRIMALDEVMREELLKRVVGEMRQRRRMGVTDGRGYME